MRNPSFTAAEAASGPVGPRARRRAAGRGIPWLGLLTLTASLFLSAHFLSGVYTVESLFQTWYLSRAAGLVSLVLLWISVDLGLLQSAGLLRRMLPGQDSIDVHAFAALLAIYAVTFHAWVLLWDTTVPFTLSQILDPFTSQYEPIMVGLGTIAFYFCLGSVVSTYLRKGLGTKVWRVMHQVSALGLVIGLIHGWVLGPDTNQPGVRALYVVIAVSTVLLTVYRMILGGAAKRARLASGG